MRVAENTTLHMMVRNEAPTCFYALASVLPYVGKAIVIDTGSTDKTIELLELAMRGYEHKVDFQKIKLPDSSGWAFGKYIPPNPELGYQRQKMVEQTETDYIWLLDGDEVYRDITCEQVVDVLFNWPEGVVEVFIPLLWFGKDINHLVVSDPPVYGLTGRLFRRKGMSVRGAFPGEMAVFDGEVIVPESKRALIRRDIEPFHHYEMVMKPWRRKTIALLDYDGPQPDVFARYAPEPTDKHTMVPIRQSKSRRVGVAG